jgi:osmotically inducible lipoprotein OsmB
MRNKVITTVLVVFLVGSMAACTRDQRTAGGAAIGAGAGALVGGALGGGGGAAIGAVSGGVLGGVIGHHTN